MRVEQIPVAFKAFHWQPVLSTNRIPFITWRYGTRRRWQPRGYVVSGTGRCDSSSDHYGQNVNSGV